MLVFRRTINVTGNWEDGCGRMKLKSVKEMIKRKWEKKNPKGLLSYTLICCFYTGCVPYDKVRGLIKKR